ncbi:bacterial SH3 domain [Clostridium sp. CAG:1000]|nr:bacterial SH3 domain [Clostridium sp. CAG:1000]
MNEDNNEQLKNKSNKVDNLSQLYSDVLEVSRINKQYKKSDIDAINNRNNFNDNKPLGVVSSSQSTSTKNRKSSLTKKDSSLKKQDLNNSSNISQDDKNKLSSKSEDNINNKTSRIIKEKKDGVKDKIDNKVKDDAKKKAVAQKISNKKLKGKASITFKLKILKIGLIVGGVLFGLILLAAIIGYILQELIPGIFDSNDWDSVESKLNDDEYMASHFNSFINKFGGGTGTCKYDVGESSYSNVKVRLYKNDRFELVYSDDRLIDFDKYILGVAYQEVGGGTDSISEQVFKTQAIAARSYALTRGKKMAGVKALQITEENGYTVVNIRQTTSDQAYCDPDEGYLPSGQLSNCSSGHLRLPDDSPLRTWIKEVDGVVLVDSNGEVVNTPYFDKDQIAWRALAQSGMTSDEIILKHYNAAEKGYTLNATCVKTSSVEGAEGWKQCDPRWGNMYVGSKTICSIGCALTSISIQLARSGVQLNVSGEFNPGTFMQTHKSNGGFSDNIITWNVSRIAPNFKLIASHEVLFGTKENKIKTLKKYAADGEYIVLGVRHGVGQDIGHYVAYNDSSSDEIFIFDPAGNTTGKLFHDYPAMANTITSFQVVRYKVEG